MARGAVLLIQRGRFGGLQQQTIRQQETEQGKPLHAIPISSSVR